MKDIECLRCHTNMNYVSTSKIQLGQTGWVLGDLPNLLAGAWELSVFACPGCGKIEFFQPDHCADHSDTPQVSCPNCAKMHDFDYPKCPFCKYNYNT